MKRTIAIADKRPNPGTPLYTLREAADYLRLSGVRHPSRTIGRYIKLGQLATIKLGRHKLLHKNELDRFVAQRFAEQNARPLPEAIVVATDPPKQLEEQQAATRTTPGAAQ